MSWRTARPRTPTEKTCPENRKESAEKDRPCSSEGEGGWGTEEDTKLSAKLSENLSPRRDENSPTDADLNDSKVKGKISADRSEQTSKFKHEEHLKREGRERAKRVRVRLGPPLALLVLLCFLRSIYCFFFSPFFCSPVLSGPFSSHLVWPFWSPLI